MKRRKFIQASGAAATATALSNVEAQRGPNQPNLLIIHCDELNFRTLGCYRDTLSPEQAFMWGPKAFVETPHIDSLAKEGALCTKFYAATPVCSPSRSSWVSGQYPQNTPVTNNNNHLSDDVITFGHQLKKAGYATGYAGKWHLDGGGKPQWAPKRSFGFDDNRYMFNRGHWKQFEMGETGPRIKARDQKGRPSYNVKGADETSFATDWLADRTIEFIEEHREASFAYMLSIPDPHGPDTVRAPYDTMFDDSLVEKPRTYDRDPKTSPSWAMPSKRCSYRMAQYHGMMKCIDDNVGKIIAALKAKNLYDKTIVIFTADHGDMRGEHGRQNKGVPLEASGKIPLVIRWPDKIKGGSQIDQAINTTDFMPTILPLMGAERSGKEEGRNLAGLFSKGKFSGEDITFMRSTTKTAADNTGWIAAVTPRYKLILSNQDDPWLLDLEDDPDELQNYIKDPARKKTVKYLANQLKQYAEQNGDPKIKHPQTAKVLAGLLG